ncbi:hypothetical protein AHAS_Ahas18G0249600 [Arachis hypogaea]
MFHQPARHKVECFISFQLPNKKTRAHVLLNLILEEGSYTVCVAPLERLKLEYNCGFSRAERFLERKLCKYSSDSTL